MTLPEPWFDPLATLSWLAEEEATWYTAVPSMHYAEAAYASGTPGRPGWLRFVRSASASLPADLEVTLGVPVLEAYGMTEAAHEIASDLPYRRCADTARGGARRLRDRDP